MKQNHIPTATEIKKAEDCLDEMQKELSNKRVAHIDSLDIDVVDSEFLNELLNLKDEFQIKDDRKWSWGFDNEKTGFEKGSRTCGVSGILKGHKIRFIKTRIDAVLGHAAPDPIYIGTIDGRNIEDNEEIDRLVEKYTSLHYHLKEYIRKENELIKKYKRMLKNQAKKINQISEKEFRNIIEGY